MPEIKEAEFLEQIKKRIFSNLYFVYGEDVFLKQRYVRMLSESVVTELPEMNMPKIDGKRSDIQRISDELYQIPLMSEYRCVLVDDFDIASLNKDQAESLFSALEDIPQSTVVVFVFNSIEIDAKKSSWKTVLNKMSKLGCLVNCVYKTDAELVQYINKWANKRNVVFDRSVAKYLIENVGRDMKKLQVEVDKLCAYKKDYISKEDIDKLSAKTPEANQYALPKAVLSLNISNSLSVLSDLLDARYEPISIVSSLADSFIDIYRVKTAIDSGKNPTDIAEDFGYGKNRLFVLKNATPYARKYSFETIMNCFEVLDKTDEALKYNVKNKRLLLEKTIILLIEIMRGYDIKALK